MLMRPFVFEDRVVRIPIIQGGMGVGVSRSRLAGAVAKAGGIGVISTAQIGYDEEGFEQDQQGCNLRAIERHIHRAKEIAGGNGMIGVNVMVALKQFEEHVHAAVRAGADLVISGAGLPVRLPELVKGSKTRIAPIVSSLKSAEVILKMWDRKYKRTADLLIIEGPMAGGHLGFSYEELEKMDRPEQKASYQEEIRRILACRRQYEEKYKHAIPVVLAGGIFDRADAIAAMELGVDGIQVGTRFVATEECDASMEYKQAYVRAQKEEIRIVKSPVGMPGRAIYNSFLQRVDAGEMQVKKCYQCLAKCNPKQIPYCITKALVDAVNGKIEDGLIFCGQNAYRVDRISTVSEVMEELFV